MYVHGNANERQDRDLEVHMVKKEERMEKQQLTRPELVTSRSIADPWQLSHGCHNAVSIIHSPTDVLVWACPIQSM